MSLHLARDFGEEDGLTQNPPGHVLDDGRERLAALKHADHRPAAIADGRGDFVEFDAITFDLDLKINSFLEKDVSVMPLGPIAGKIGAFGAASDFDRTKNFFGLGWIAPVAVSELRPGDDDLPFLGVPPADQMNSDVRDGRADGDGRCRRQR